MIIRDTSARFVVGSQIESALHDCYSTISPNLVFHVVFDNNPVSDTMCSCSKTDKVISGMFLYICLAIGSTVLTVILVEWLYIIPLRDQKAQSNSFLSGNGTDISDVVYEPSTGTL